MSYETDASRLKEIEAEMAKLKEDEKPLWDEAPSGSYLTKSGMNISTFYHPFI